MVVVGEISLIYHQQKVDLDLLDLLEIQEILMQCQNGEVMMLKTVPNKNMDEQQNWQ